MDTSRLERVRTAEEIEYFNEALSELDHHLHSRLAYRKLNKTDMAELLATVFIAFYDSNYVRVGDANDLTGDNPARLLKIFDDMQLHRKAAEEIAARLMAEPEEPKSNVVQFVYRRPKGSDEGMENA